MKRPGIAWILTLLLASCSTASWDKPGATKESVQKDGDDCWEDARVKARSYTSPSAGGGVVVGAPASQSRDRAMDQTAEFQRCMRDKGYSEKR
jgi:hypothetical protein